MKRTFLYTFVLIALVFSTTLPDVNAHSGKTDSKGGHTNHNTGEYHYHHGYPAHDHYDMDGDGDIDCPYDFKDNTNRDSGGSDSHTGSTVPIDNIVESTKSVNTKSAPPKIIAFLAIALYLFLMFILPLLKK